MINKILGKRKAIKNDLEEVKHKFPELYLQLKDQQDMFFKGTNKPSSKEDIELT